jgi:hypothetical protein
MAMRTMSTDGRHFDMRPNLNVLAPGFPATSGYNPKIKTRPSYGPTVCELDGTKLVTFRRSDIWSI